MTAKVSDISPTSADVIISEFDRGLTVVKSSCALYGMLQERAVEVITPAIDGVSKTSDFWQRTGDALRELGENPGAIFLGVVQGLGLATSAWNFARTFSGPCQTRQLKLKRDCNTILGERIIAGFNLTGSMARFASWVHTEFFWTSGGALTVGLLGGIGSAMGIIRGGSRAFAALDDIKETQRLIDNGDEFAITPKETFKNIQWIHMLNYASNIFFVSFCVVGILTLAVGGVIFPPLAGILLFGSLVTMLSSFFMKMGNRKEEQKLEFLKANDIGKDYTYWS